MSICWSRTRNLALLHEMRFHVQCWIGWKFPSTYNYVGGVVNPTLVLSLKLRTLLSFHVPNDLIRVYLLLRLSFSWAVTLGVWYTQISLFSSAWSTRLKCQSPGKWCWLLSLFQLPHCWGVLLPSVGWTVEGMCTLQNAYINMKLSSPKILRKFYGKHGKSMFKTSLPVSHLPVHCSIHYCSAKLWK